MNVNHYIGFDVHKKSVNYCVKTADGTIIDEGRLRATHDVLRRWAGERPEPWHGAMEATLFSGWIYDTLQPFAAELQMGHPALMKAIAASKKKNDKLDARKIADMVRCNLLPACYVAPVEIRELRRMLRYRNLVVGQATRMKNKMSGLLMEVGAEYNKQRLHGKQYFTALLDTVTEVPDSVKDLLRLSRGAMETFETAQQQLLARLRKDPLLSKRVLVLEEHSRRGRSDGADVGVGSERSATVLFHRPFLAVKGTATGRLSSSCATPSVSRPAGSLKLNLRGRPCAVPANGCLVTLTLMRWPNPQRIASSKSFSSSSDPLPRFRRLFQVQGKFCFPLTSPYHGCPLSPFTLDYTYRA